MSADEIKAKVEAKEAKKANPKEVTIDPATVQMLQKAQADGCETIFDRAVTMKPCNIGEQGTCCKTCAQGPCRLPLTKKQASRASIPARVCAAPRPRPSRRATSRA